MKYTNENKLVSNILKLRYELKILSQNANFLSRWFFGLSLFTNIFVQILFVHVPYFTIYTTIYYAVESIQQFLGQALESPRKLRAEKRFFEHLQRFRSEKIFCLTFVYNWILFPIKIETTVYFFAPKHVF